MTATVQFQFMPPLLPSEYQALTESIRALGVQVPVIVDESGAIIDGHHRQQIAAELGVHCPREVRAGLSDADKRTLAISLNKDRRHLTREQVRALVAESIKADPHLSDRAHAQRTGASPTTVGKVRAMTPQVSNLDTSPAPESERIDPATGEVVPAPTFKPMDVTDWTDEELERLEAADALTIETWEASTIPAPEPRKVTGLDGKTYTRPAVPASTADRRPPLRDGFRDAALDLAKIVGRFERLAADDRLSRNKNEVARYANDLTLATDALQRIAEQLTN